MRRAWLLLFVALALVPRAAWAQGGAPLGPEFRVNTYTTSNQLYPSVDADSLGNFVVVWTSNLQDTSSLGVFGQRYASSGVPVGPEFRVNTYTTAGQYRAAVASDGAGNFVVAWTSFQQDGSYKGVFGQRYASSGAPAGPEFRINTYTSDNQAFPSIASDSAGNFVVVWESYGQDGSSWGAFGQRYANTGAPLGPEFRVNTYTSGLQYLPAVASDPSGNFFVVWDSDAQDGSGRGVFGQRYASSGATLGLEFRVNTYTTGSQYFPTVASDASGNFVVVWQSNGQDGSSLGVFGQRFASSGVTLGPEFRVNSYTTGYQSVPTVAADSAGNFVVAWVSYPNQDGSSYGVFGQRYSNTGAALGPEFRVNTFTANSQNRPALAAEPTGNFVVTWDSQLQDGSGLGVFGQRYGPIVPVELMQFGVQ